MTPPDYQQLAEELANTLYACYSLMEPAERCDDYIDEAFTRICQEIIRPEVRAMITHPEVQP